MPFKIVLAGEGGQGVQTVGKIVSLSSTKSGGNISYLPNFGVEQRGGVSLVFLQMSGHLIPYPRFAKADIIVCFCNRAVSVIKKYLQENTIFIYDNSAIENENLAKVKNEVKNYMAIPAQQIGRERFTSKVANIVLLGGLISNLKELNYQEVENALLEEFADKIAKKPELKELNLGALKAGLEEAEKFDKQKQPFEGISPQSIQRVYPIKNSQNGEAIWERFPEYCKSCGLCINKCPVDALTFSKDVCFLGLPLPIVDPEKCISCLKCMEICPEGAIRVEKSES